MERRISLNSARSVLDHIQILKGFRFRNSSHFRAKRSPKMGDDLHVSCYNIDC
ncbi:hypothetical protein BVRB_7g157820 [Beta vulgaris subsp. vulgaris]|nr:hypothetical protein BVRB_7g157820 [Beta vulgaris subsp. vulgaris]